MMVVVEARPTLREKEPFMNGRPDLSKPTLPSTPTLQLY
jgi:hypothetical protein